MEKKRDIVIASLEFARDETLSGKMIEVRDLRSHLISIGVVTEPISPPMNQFIQTLCNQITGSALADFMKFEAYMALFDYEELQHAVASSEAARKDSVTAIWYARASLILGALVGLAQIVVTIWPSSK